MSPTLVNRRSLTRGISPKVWWLWVCDWIISLIKEKQQVRIIWTAPNYKEFVLLWGAFTYTSGEKREFLVEGTEWFCEKVSTHLFTSGGSGDIVLRRVLKD